MVHSWYPMYRGRCILATPKKGYGFDSPPYGSVAMDVRSFLPYIRVSVPWVGIIGVINRVVVVRTLCKLLLGTYTPTCNCVYVEGQGD